MRGARPASVAPRIGGCLKNRRGPPYFTGMHTWPSPGTFDPTHPHAGLARIDGHLHLQFHPVENGPLECAVQDYIDRLFAPRTFRTLPVPRSEVEGLRAAAGQR